MCDLLGTGAVRTGHKLPVLSRGIRCPDCLHSAGTHVLVYRGLAVVVANPPGREVDNLPDQLVRVRAPVCLLVATQAIQLAGKQQGLKVVLSCTGHTQSTVSFGQRLLNETHTGQTGQDYHAI